MILEFKTRFFVLQKYKFYYHFFLIGNIFNENQLLIIVMRKIFFKIL